MTTTDQAKLAELAETVIAAKAALATARHDAEEARREEAKARNRATEAENAFNRARVALDAELDR